MSSDSASSSLAVLRVLRLARIFRVFKLAKYSESLQLFGKVMETSLLALYILLFVCGVGTVVFGSLIYFAEGGTWDPKSGQYYRKALDGQSTEVSPFQSIPGSFWW